MINMKQTRRSVTTVSGTVTAEELRTALELPRDAVILFQVPTGGDYSGDRLAIDEHPLIVTWQVIKDEVIL